MGDTCILLEGCPQCEEIRSNMNHDEISMGKSCHQIQTAHKPVTKIVSLPSPCQQEDPSQSFQLQRSRSYPLSRSHALQICSELSICLDCSRSPDGDCDGQTGLKEIQRRRSSRHHKQRGLASMRDSLPGSLESLEDVFVLVDTEPSIFAAHHNHLYEEGEQEVRECSICLSDTRWVRPCCKMPTCSNCLQWYIWEKVSFRIINIECPNPACSSNISREEILQHLSSALRKRFLQFLIEENCDPNQKTCPNCNLVAELEKDVVVRNHLIRPDEYQVACPCGLLWCFRCHAPWHKNVSCKQYQRGNRLLRKWAKEFQNGQANAHNCPKCKVLIQRSEGCDHMKCAQCHTPFCYRCGKQFRGLPFIGDHNSRYSVFGCKEGLMPNHPIMRKAVRGTVFGCVVTATGIGIIIAVGVVVIGAVGLAPVYVPYLVRQKYYRKRWRQRHPQVEGRAYREYPDGR